MMIVKEHLGFKTKTALKAGYAYSLEDCKDACRLEYAGYVGEKDACWHGCRKGRNRVDNDGCS